MTLISKMLFAESYGNELSNRVIKHLTNQNIKFWLYPFFSACTHFRLNFLFVLVSIFFPIRKFLSQ